MLWDMEVKIIEYLDESVWELVFGIGFLYVFILCVYGSLRVFIDKKYVVVVFLGLKVENRGYFILIMLFGSGWVVVFLEILILVKRIIVLFVLDNVVEGREKIMCYLWVVVKGKRIGINEDFGRDMVEYGDEIF